MSDHQPHSSLASDRLVLKASITLVESAVAVWGHNYGHDTEGGHLSDGI